MNSWSSFSSEMIINFDEKARNKIFSEIQKVGRHGSVILQQELARVDDPLWPPPRVVKFTQLVRQKSENVDRAFKNKTVTSSSTAT
jgi:hypothetical protein